MAETETTAFYRAKDQYSNFKTIRLRLFKGAKILDRLCACEMAILFAKAFSNVNIWFRLLR